MLFYFLLYFYIRKAKNRKKKMNFGELLDQLYDVENDLYHMNLYAAKMGFGEELSRSSDDQLGQWLNNIANIDKYSAVKEIITTDKYKEALLKIIDQPFIENFRRTRRENDSGKYKRIIRQDMINLGFPLSDSPHELNRRYKIEDRADNASLDLKQFLPQDDPETDQLIDVLALAINTKITDPNNYAKYLETLT